MSASKRKKNDLLGTPPWDKEHLTQCYFSDFLSVTEKVAELSGGKIFSELSTVRLSLKIFLSAVDDLLSSINEFKYRSARPNFWHQTNTPFVDSLEVSVQRGILSSTLCAMTLVDHCREFEKTYPLEGYSKKTKAFFSENELHRFIHSLRRYVAHVRFTKANFQIHNSKEGRAVFFLLKQKTLLKFTGWDALSKVYISKHPNGINVESLFINYAASVEKFHRWLFVSVFDKHGTEVSEYLSYVKIISEIGSKGNWDLIVKQILEPQKISRSV